MEKSEDNLRDSVLSFYHVCLRDWIQATRLGSEPAELSCRLYFVNSPRVLNIIEEIISI